VILFVASPLDGVDVGELVKLGKLLKKNNVAIDVINFGTENTSNDNTEKLEQLIAAVNTADNSHLVSIPPGPHIFADLVLTSAIMQSGGGGAGIAGVPSGAGGGAAGGGASVGGIDPNMDPEMAMAIRMSMEEERQRQQKAAGEAAATPSGGAAGAQPPAAAAPVSLVVACSAKRMKAAGGVPCSSSMVTFVRFCFFLRVLRWRRMKMRCLPRPLRSACKRTPMRRWPMPPLLRLARPPLPLPRR
jgi:26S proteasome regulatory subunit N10